MNLKFLNIPFKKNTFIQDEIGSKSAENSQKYINFFHELIKLAKNVKKILILAREGYTLLAKNTKIFKNTSKNVLV